MTEDEMYEHVRAQMRGKVQSGNDPGYVGIALRALYNTLTEAGTICLAFRIGDEHLYVQCDGIPFRSIKTIEFLASANFLTCRIEARNRLFEFDGLKDTLPTAYIHIYKEPNEHKTSI